MRRLHLPIVLPVIAACRVDGRTFVLHAGRCFVRWDGDRLAYASFDVCEAGRLVAQVFVGSYGPDRYSVSLRATRGLGEGLDMMDHYTHDSGPFDSRTTALRVAAKGVVYIEKARQRKAV